MEYILTFKTTNFAIKAEQCLLEKALQVGVIPLPTKLSAGCGLSLRIKPEEIRQALSALSEQSIPMTGLYTRVSENNSFSYTEVADEDILFSPGT